MRGVTGNLPQELTSFVGRRQELSQVKRLLAQSRLVTLVGVGGVGKTRLALQAAAGMRRSFEAGVWLVELDQVRDEALVPHAVARALGLREEAGLAPEAMLSTHLADRPLLLVLDNCEHLVCGVAKLVERLLRDTSELRILTTSRQQLNIDGERLQPVTPLPVPDPQHLVHAGHLEEYEGVALFLERARAVLPGFELGATREEAVGEICSRLDGLPLAIELVVARLRVLTPEQIRDRLADPALLSRGTRTAPARQQTMRGCIEWSHDLCTPAEQLLWARLAVFTGDWDADAAEGVCADDRLPSGSVRELIASLEDKSILIAQQEQGGVVGYRMLDSIRDFGRARLRERGEEAMLRRRHRDWHQQLAARFALEWMGPGQRDWLRRLDRMLPDVRAALEYSLSESGPADEALAICVDLQMFWAVSGLYHQARRWLGQALEPPGPSTPVRMKALYFDAARATGMGQLQDATARVSQARDVARDLGDAHSRALVMAGEGTLAAARGDLALTVRLYQDALDVFRAEGDEFWQAVALTHLTMTKVLLDDTSGAVASHEVMQAISERTGERWFCGFTAMSVGTGLWKQGDLDAAADRMTQSMHLLRRTGDIMATSWCLEVTAWIAAARDKPERAATLLGAAAALAESMGTWPTMWRALLTYHEQCEHQVRRALGEQAFHLAFGRLRNAPLDEVIALALDEPEPAESPDSTPDPLSSLTSREHDVAALLALGLSNKNIAEHLVLSPRTVEGHVENILRKLNCTGRAEAAALIVTISPDTDQEH